MYKEPARPRPHRYRKESLGEIIVSEMAFCYCPAARSGNLTAVRLETSTMTAPAVVARRGRGNYADRRNFLFFFWFCVAFFYFFRPDGFIAAVFFRACPRFRGLSSAFPLFVVFHAQKLRAAKKNGVFSPGEGLSCAVLGKFPASACA